MLEDGQIYYVASAGMGSVSKLPAWELPPKVIFVQGFAGFHFVAEPAGGLVSKIPGLGVASKALGFVVSFLDFHGPS